MERKIQITDSKQCPRCEEYLTLDKFYKDSRYKDGIKHVCIRCIAIPYSGKNSYNPNQSKINHKNCMKKWRKINPNLDEKHKIKHSITYLTKRGYKVIAPQL